MKYNSNKIFKDLGLPSGDLYDLPSSQKRFDDQGQYRFEVPGIQSPKIFEALAEEVIVNKLRIHRVTQTKGIMLLSDLDIKEMLSIAEGINSELVLSVGPRATYDTSASVNTDEGMRMGYRLRGQDQVARALDDIIRAHSLGCSSFLIYDEGFAWLINQAKAAGLLSANIKVKMSAHSGHGNPCAAKLLESNGITSLNPVRDIQLQMLASIRSVIKIPLDLHTENPKSSGGFIRHYEVPEMIRIASPVYLKTGGSVAQSHSWETSESDAIKRIKQVMLVRRVINEYYPEAIQSD